MKNVINILGMLLLVGGMFMMTSCGDDDIVIDTGSGSLNVGDGMFLALAILIAALQIIY